MSDRTLFDVHSAEWTQPMSTLDYDAYVAVRQERAYYGEPDRYGEVKYKIVPVIAWETAGTLEYCRGMLLDEDFDQVIIYRIRGKLEPVEVVEPSCPTESMPRTAQRSRST